MIAPLWQRLRMGVTRAPSWRDLRYAALELAWLTPVLLVIGFSGGLMQWSPTADQTTLKLALVAIVAPALGEELLFRAAILPTPSPDLPLPLGPVALSTALFVLWHPLQAPLFGPHWAEVMLNPLFLVAVAAVGLASARLYWKSGSIWPSVALHWVVVVAWKALLDGPSPWVT